MTSRLILARHGNTFGPGDLPVWVGARSDLPLVEKGFVQAAEIGNALRAADIVPDSIIAGPLQRTRQTAQKITEILGLPGNKVKIDTRLTEIDYGAWEGKSTEAIIAAGGEQELNAWNKNSVFPPTPGWKPAEAQILADTGTLLRESGEGTGLIVTSNGILRFFARATVNGGDFPDRKVATGHLCVMKREGAAWRILAWNLPPEQLAAYI